MSRPASRTLVAVNGAKVRTAKKQRWVAVVAYKYTWTTGNTEQWAKVLSGSNNLWTLRKRVASIARNRGISPYDITIYDMLTGQALHV